MKDRNAELLIGILRRISAELDSLGSTDTMIDILIAELEISIEHEGA